MSKSNIKKGSEVEVISGSHKGKKGKVLHVDRKKNRVLVEKIAMVKKHTRPNKEKGIEGGVVEREGSIHISNVKCVPESKSQNN